MPKIGMEPVRRKALVEATIAEIGRAGSLDVTVLQIAKRAGMSSALAHHYFGGKAQIFLAAMRHIMTEYGGEVRRELASAAPDARAEAIVRASFAASSFAPDCISAWMNFYVLAQTDAQALRLWRVYQKRLRSNLIHALRPLCSDPAAAAAILAAQIDGLYIHAALNDPSASAQACDQAMRVLAMLKDRAT